MLDTVTTDLLRFEGLQRVAGDKVLLRAASGAIHDGDRIALIGASGSGKSVLMRAIAGIEPFQAGCLFFRGQSYEQYAPQVWHEQLALIAQAALMMAGTVEDNLRLPFSFKHYRGRVFSRDFHVQHLALLGKAPDFLQQDALKLSGGERQLVNLLRTLQLNPTLLLLDEPTAALDSETKAQIALLIRQWYGADKGRAYVWISHDRQEAALMCSRFWSMRAGELVGDE